MNTNQNLIGQRVREMADTFRQRNPALWKLCEPRRYVPPAGYANPHYHSGTLFGQWHYALEPELDQLPHSTGMMSAMMLISHEVPTYFIRPEFAQAVAQTDPPLDFRLGEIRWPLDAMLFVLPDEFVMRYFKYYCPFIAVSKCVSGFYPETIQGPTKRIWPPGMIQNEVDRFVCTFPCYTTDKEGYPADFCSNYPLKMTLSEIDDVSIPYCDATFFEERLVEDRLGTQIFDINSGTDEQVKEAEKAMLSRVRNFAIRLLLCLSAKPDYVNRTSTCQRPAKIKKGREREALWTPNFIGDNYRAARISATPGQGGSHGSPRMHWRRGHWANQATNQSLEGFVSVKDMPLNAKSEIDWPNVSEDLRNRFWNFHKRCWIEPVLVNAEDDTQP
jgi:hypothetical protein